MCRILLRFFFFFAGKCGGREEDRTCGVSGSLGESAFWPDIQSDQLLPEHSRISANGGKMLSGFLKRS